MALRAFDEDTIVAVATPPGEGGIGVVRLSGPRAVPIAGAFFEAAGRVPLERQPSHTARYGRVWSGGVGSGTPLDDVLALVMRAPRSYTREDVVEISAHGSPAVLERIVSEALAHGARLALPGEFTKRAFLNGRVDLVQAEAVLDLIQARGERARRWALGRLEGELSRRLAAFRETLLDILSHLEASIDFPEDDLAPRSLRDARERLSALEEEVRSLAEKAGWGLAAKNGWSVVITGKPNVGKSSLMNRLLGRDRVIVTPTPGTTRDVVEDHIQLGGFSIRLSDTAGLRDSEHPVERQGIARTRQALSAADLVIAVLDLSSALDAQDETVLGDTASLPRLIALNKADLPAAWSPEVFPPISGGPRAVRCSAVAAPGTEELERALLEHILTGGVPRDDEGVVGSARQKDCLERVADALRSALEACRTHPSPELVAVGVRQAVGHLGELVGEIYTDDVLEKLFGQFCVGK